MGIFQEIFKYCAFRKGLWLLAACLWISLPASGQDRHIIDSLLQVLKENLPDTTKADICYELARQYRFSSPDTAMRYAQRSLMHAENSLYDIGRLKAANFQGLIAQTTGDYPQAMQQHLRALRIAETKKDLFYIGLTCSYLGALHKRQNNLSEAARYLMRAKKALEEIHSSRTYTYLANIMSQLGSVYAALGHADIAEKHYAESIRIKEEIGDFRGLADTFDQLGSLWKGKGEYGKAVLFSQKALDIKLQLGDRMGVSAMKLTLSDTYRNMGRLQEAEKWARAALAVAENMDERAEYGKALELLSKIYSDKRQYQEAYQYLLKAKAFEDSLYQTEASKQMAEWEAKYELERGKAENERLKAYSEAMQAEIFKQRAAIIAIGLSLAGLSVLLALLFRSYKEKKEIAQTLMAQREELRRQAHDLEEANRVSKQANDRLAHLLEDSKAQTKILWDQQEEITAQNEALLQQRKQLDEKNKDLENAILKLKQAQAQLVQSEKMASLGQLTAGIAHEINNPVNFIGASIGGLEMLMADVVVLLKMYEAHAHLLPQKELKRMEADLGGLNADQLQSDAKELLGSISIGAKRTAEIVKELRSFSRMDEKVRKLTDLHESLESTLVMLRSQMVGISLSKYYGLLPKVECYAGKINQVFMNLLTNAVQALEGVEDGEIVISTHFAADSSFIGPIPAPFVSVIIADNGPGIPPSYMSRVFDPFFTTKEVGKGTGLGLAISMSIIEEHNGKIVVESAEGKGATFTVYLPVQEGAE